MDTLQYVKLHGSLPCKPTEMTFSPRQYGSRQSQHDPLYWHFVQDYCQYPTIFVGTELSEPIFFQYLDARERRQGRDPEGRARAFLVSPSIGEAESAVFSAMNVVPLRATGEQFFSWLSQVVERAPGRMEVLRRSNPRAAELIETIDANSPARRRRLEEFYESFHFVKPMRQKKGHNKRSFFNGYTPTWQDLAFDLDGSRDVNATLEHQIRAALAAEGTQCVALVGAAGSGKTTTMMRVAWAFGASGVPTYYAVEDDLPSVESVAGALDMLGQRCLLFFDNADLVFSWLGRLVDALSNLEKPPVLVIASRLNRYDASSGPLTSRLQVAEVDIGNLTRRDITGILKVLAREHFLGHLAGLSAQKQVAEFEVRAEKQILVALKEATEGKGFDEIIGSEYSDLESREARIVCLAAALVTAERYPIRRTQLMSCSTEEPASALAIIDRQLRGVVVPHPDDSALLRVRHAVIADHIIRACANGDELKEAYCRVLRVLSQDVAPNVTRSSKRFRVYRSLINHQRIHERFSPRVEYAREIYESIRDSFRNDAQFWHQFGALELEFGELDYAATYIATAESLAPNDSLIQNTRAHLQMKRALVASSETQALDLWRDGTRILGTQIALRGDSVYPFHIWGDQAVRFWRRVKGAAAEQVLVDAKERVQQGLRRFPGNRKLLDVNQRIRRAELEFAAGL
ncbi:SIR2 family protein [Sandaracinus amylolyticus]|uniref:P-loop NTPase n=1 Tax=Sandaracinus amylolyticus TaxID=927083 RepID=UPI001F1F87F5|nr:SIR2 family protein [Sandaracinus amylolyticus]UJR84201.1 Hypothetical protein I5071_62720 [Sandaracinus amylolyticus]